MTFLLNLNQAYQSSLTLVLFSLSLSLFVGEGGAVERLHVSDSIDDNGSFILFIML